MLDSTGVRRHVEAGEPIYLAGDACDKLYELLEGHVVTVKSNFYEKRRILDVFFPGDIFGYDAPAGIPYLTESAFAVTEAIYLWSPVSEFSVTPREQSLLRRLRAGGWANAVPVRATDREQMYYIVVTLRERFGNTIPLPWVALELILGTSAEIRGLEDDETGIKITDWQAFLRGCQKVDVFGFRDIQDRHRIWGTYLKNKLRTKKEYRDMQRRLRRKYNLTQQELDNILAQEETISEPMESTPLDEKD